MTRSPLRPAAAALGAAAALLLVGCAEDGGDSGLQGTMGGILDSIGGLGGGGTTIAYDCDDGRELTATFSADRGEVLVEAEDEGGDEDSIRLELSRRGDDRRVYTSDDGDVRFVVFGDDGGEAELSVEDGDDFEDCDRQA